MPVLAIGQPPLANGWPQDGPRNETARRISLIIRAGMDFTAVASRRGTLHGILEQRLSGSSLVDGVANLGDMGLVPETGDRQSASG